MTQHFYNYRLVAAAHAINNGKLFSILINRLRSADAFARFRRKSYGPDAKALFVSKERI